MKGIILARNCREAFLPLTETCSHLMIHFFNQPVIDFQLQLLHRWGITDICVVAEEDNKELKTYLEAEHKAQFILLGMNGISLSELAHPHKSCLFLPQLTLTDFTVNDFVSEHGSVTAVFSSRDELCQKGLFFFGKETYHFHLQKGKDILSALAEQKIPTNIHFQPDFFRAVTNLTEYKNALEECLDHPELFSQCHHSGGVIHEGNTFIEVGAKIKPPVYLGNHVTIAKNAEILPYSVICSQSAVCENAKISHSVLLPQCSIEPSASVSGSILDWGVTVTQCTATKEGSIYGKNVIISAQNQSAVSSDNPTEHSASFGEYGLRLPKENVSAFLQKLGNICGALFESGILGIFQDDTVQAQFLSHSLCSGLQSSGAAIYAFPPCTLAMCRSACPFYRLNAGFYLYKKDQDNYLMLLDANGYSISPAMEEKICTALHQKTSARIPGALKKIVETTPYQIYYYSDITRRLGTDAAECKLWTDISSPMVWEYLERIANCHKITLSREPVHGVIGFSCNASATEFTLYDESQTPLTPRQCETLIAALAAEKKESEFVITPHTSHALCSYLTEKHITPIKADSHPHFMETKLGKLPFQAYLTRDPVYFIITLLLQLHRQQNTLSQWMATLPKSFLIEKNITTGKHLTETLKRLLTLAQEDEQKANNQYQFHSKKGITTVTVTDNNLKIISESAKEEYAKELTDFYVKQCSLEIY
ncbi:MAG: hypothetical protein J6K51_02695 [Clostridia bacterium]|nr:hypothetical protein [Clostridia bacterium]